MREKEAVAKLKTIADGSFYKDDLWDIENQHGDADDVLCDFLRYEGHHELVDAWLEVPKWYA